MFLSLNSTIIEFVIKVVDAKNPVIAIIGDVFINLCRFRKLDEDSVTVTDNYDNNLVASRTSSSNYDEYLIYYKAGFNTMNYTVTDNSGNKADEKHRNIYVNECEWYSVNDGGLEEYVSLYRNNVFK